MAEQLRQGGADHASTSGGDGGVPEHEREKAQPEKVLGTRGGPAGTAAQGQPTAAQAERQQLRDLASGEENPG